MKTLHLALRVADVERSLAFYTALGYEVLGSVPATELGSLTMLKLQGDEFVSLELVHDAEIGRVEPGALSHFVIQVEAMHTAVAGLAARGIPTEEPASPDGSGDFWTAWVTDPDGHRIELVQWPDGHAHGMTRSDLAEENAASRSEAATGCARDLVAELFARQQSGDETVFDDLIAVDMVNHAAGPQGRDGLKEILRTIEVDLGPTKLEQHHLIDQGDLVVQHVTLHGTHRASTMPLLTDTPASGRRAAWTFIHIWRADKGMLVEHWACRDDRDLLEQLRPS